MGVVDARSSEPLVLVVDDEDSVRQALERALRLEGFAVATADGGRTALDRIRAQPPAVVVLDVTMPDLDGIQVVKRIRADGLDVPVCILSARDEVDDRVRGLEAGADDYVVKPFALEEVAARLHALLRRRPAPPAERLEAGDIVVDTAAMRATRADRDLELTRREFELLALFVRRPGEILTRREMHEDVWGYTFDPGTNVADVFVGYLRRKLEAGGEPRILHTVRGVGFVLQP
jgi:DNA-binding response OmpR family regulator